MAVLAVFVTFVVVYFGAQQIFETQFKSIGDTMNFRETESIVAWVGRILYSVIFCYIFLQGYKNKGVGEGVRYGLLIGLLLIGLDIDWFGVTNVVLSDALTWWVTDLVAAIVGGAVLAEVYKPRVETEAKAE
jgi:hypothetical protein